MDSLRSRDLGSHRHSVQVRLVCCGLASRPILAGRCGYNLDHFGSVLGGIAIGLLISLLLSPEFWQLARRSPTPIAWLKSIFKA